MVLFNFHYYFFCVAIEAVIVLLLFLIFVENSKQVKTTLLLLLLFCQFCVNRFLSSIVLFAPSLLSSCVYAPVGLIKASNGTNSSSNSWCIHPLTEQCIHLPMLASVSVLASCVCPCTVHLPVVHFHSCEHTHTQMTTSSQQEHFFLVEVKHIFSFCCYYVFFTNLNLIIFKTIWPICSTDRPFSRHFSFFLCNFVIACEMDALRKALEVFWESTEKSGTKYVLTFLELTRATEQQTKMCANCGYVCGHTIIPEPTPAHYCHFKRQSCLHCTTARQYVECSAVCVILNLNIIVHSTMAVVLMLKSCQNYCQTHKWCQE